jgi:multicomponent Na+:H+ antiporter subunit F
MTATADILFAAATALVVLAVPVGYRVVAGPTMQDRVVAANVAGTTTVVVVALLAAGTGDPGLLDVALVYGLLNFLLSVGFARVVGEGAT